MEGGGERGGKKQKTRHYRGHRVVKAWLGRCRGVIPEWGEDMDSTLIHCQSFMHTAPRVLYMPVSDTVVQLNSDAKQQGGG